MHKYKKIFDTTALHADLNNRSLRSGAVTMTSQGLMLVLQLGSTMILARILSPQDYGINAMAVAITGFANIFGHLGLSTVTIQRADINHEQVSALFWINVSMGVLLNIIIAALSPVAAWFYKAPEMFWVMLALSTVFTVSGLSIQHTALLKRQMRFYSIAKIQVLSMFAGILVAIVAGHYGLGYWALVLNTFTNVTCNTLGSWFACKWIPTLSCRNAEVRSMLKFGGDLVGYNVISYFARNLDNVLIGRYHGSGPLGLYSKAYQLLMMPITNLEVPMSSIAMPALSRLQHEPIEYRSYFNQYLSLLAFFAMPLVVFMFVCSDLLISVLLGSQWIAASAIFKILATVALFQPVFGTYSLILLSLGRSRQYFKIGMIYSVFISSSFFIGLPWGAEGVASSYAIAFYLLLLPMLYFSIKDTPIDLSLFVKAVFRPLVASLLMGVGCWNIILYLEHYNNLLLLFIVALSVVPLFLAFFVAIPGGSACVKGYYVYVKDLLFKNR